MTAQPTLKAPPGTTDCHIHVYDAALPLAPTAKFKPPHAPVEDYLAVRKLLGIERTVVVQPTSYGWDNTLTLDTVRRMGASARGVVVIDEKTSDAELTRLNGLGVRGVRFFMLPGGVLGWDVLERMAARLAEIGWSITFQMDGRNFPDREAAINRVECDLVIDHTGKFLEPVATDSAAFKSLLRILDNERRWIKLAAPYETSKKGPPYYDDVGVMAKALVRHAPDRTLWASNWPHPNFKPEHAWMLDMLLDWVPDEKVRQKVLVDNPARLYGF
ncbi:MAG: amidohydrolase family protein [Pseudolabrys sp.]|nr:amidohydrolase family protein [Pseudolabrys sp.]